MQKKSLEMCKGGKIAHLRLPTYVPIKKNNLIKSVSAQRNFAHASLMQAVTNYSSPILNTNRNI